MNNNDLFMYHGRRYTVQEFAQDHADGDIDQALSIIEILEGKGKVTPVTAPKTPTQKKLERDLAEDEIRQQVESLDNQNQAYKHSHQKTSGFTHKKVELEFRNTFEAQEAEMELAKDFGLTDTEIKIKQGQVRLVIKNVDDRILAKVERRYTANKAIAAGLSYAETGIGKTVNAVDYAATKIAAPAFQMGTHGAVSILKSLVRVATKTGATLVTATSQGVKQTAAEIAIDPEIARAKHELITAKDAITNKLNSVSGSSRGIYVSEDDGDED